MKFSSLIRTELDKLHQVYFKKPLGISAFIATSIVSRKDMYRLNRDYRSKAKSTDILSFPSSLSYSEHENALKEQFLNQIIYGKHVPIQFGHIVICPDVVMSRISGKFALRKLLIHSFAHLCNFDHHTRKDFKEMRRFELELLSKVSRFKVVKFE